MTRPGQHRQAYENRYRNRGKRAIIAYIIGAICLLLFEFIKASPRLAELAELINRSEEEESLMFQVLGVLLMYVLPAAGITIILATTYMLLFKKEDIR